MLHFLDIIRMTKDEAEWDLQHYELQPEPYIEGPHLIIIKEKHTNNRRNNEKHMIKLS